MRVKNSGILVSAVLILCGVLFLFLCSLCLRWTVDDFYILLRYAQNAAEGHGLVYNLGEKIEGYTCFAWFLVLIAAAKSGLSTYWAGKIGSLFLGLLSVPLTYLLAVEVLPAWRWRRVSALLVVWLVAVNSTHIFWSVCGLETQLFNFTILATLWLVIIEPNIPFGWVWRRRGVLIGQCVLSAIASLCRPEGILLVGFVIAEKLWRLALGRLWVRTLVLTTVSSVLPFALHLAWRVSYYGQWLPNTYYAKMGGSLAERLYRGGLYVLGGLASAGFGWLGKNGQTALPGLFLFFLLPLLALGIPGERRAHGLLFLYSILNVATTLAEGGDWMPHHRFLLPAVVLWMILFIASLHRVTLFFSSVPRIFPLWRWLGTGCIMLSLLLGLDQLRLFLKSCLVFRKEYQRGIAADHPRSWAMTFSRAMLEDRPAGQATLAASDIGVVGYVTRYRVVDLAGLTDSYIGHSEGGSCQKQFDISYVLGQGPDYVIVTSQFRPDRQLSANNTFRREYDLMMTMQGHALYRRVHSDSDPQ